MRFADLGSGDYRRGVARLAERLVEANMKAEEANVASAASALESLVEDASDDSPGLLDQLATTEETLPQLKTTVEDIGQEIELIGQIMQDAAADMERGTSQGKGFAARLAVARRVSQEMREPAERVWSFGNDFASQLHQVDAGIRAMIEGGAIEARESPVSLAGLCTFFDSVRELSNSVDEGLSGIQSMIEAISPVEAMSRDLRDPLRRLRQGLTLMLEAREVAGEWVKLIEDTGIDCDDVADESSS